MEPDTGNITYSSVVGDYSYGQIPRDCSPSGPCAGPHAVKAAGSRTFQYDLNGNLIQSQDARTGVTSKVTWNADNLPVQFQSSSNIPAEQITYDADGNEVASTTTKAQSVQQTTRYFGLADEEDGHLVNNYMIAGRWIASGDNADRRYYHLDALGSARAVTDGYGKQTSWDRFSAYGISEVLRPWGKPADIARFAGHRIDTNTSLINMGARWYDPTLGRFISPDNIIPDLTNPQTLNPYSYAQNNPTSRVDPSGHQDVQSSEEILPEDAWVLPEDEWEPEIVIGQTPADKALESGLADADYNPSGVVVAPQTAPLEPPPTPQCPCFRGIWPGQARVLLYSA